MLARIDTLNRTVQDILTYAKPSPPKLQRFNITALLGEVASAARAAVPAARFELTGEPVVVNLDPEMTRAALLNLMRFDFVGRPGHGVYLGAYLVVGAGAIAVLVLTRTTPVEPVGAPAS